MHTDDTKDTIQRRTAKVGTIQEEEELLLKELRVAIWESLQEIAEATDKVERVSDVHEAQIDEWYSLGDLIDIRKKGNQYKIDNHELTIL